MNEAVRNIALSIAATAIAAAAVAAVTFIAVVAHGVVVTLGLSPWATTFLTYAATVTAVAVLLWGR